MPTVAATLDNARLGLQTDVAREVARWLGTPTVRWRETPTTRLAATARRYDIAIATLPVGESPDAALAQSRPFFGDEVGVFARQRTVISGSDDIASHRIAVGDGVALRLSRARFPSSFTTGFPVPGAALEAVAAGRAEVALISLPSALSLAGVVRSVELRGRLPGADLDVFVGEPGSAVVAAVDKALAALTADGTLSRIRERWFPGSTELTSID